MPSTWSSTVPSSLHTIPAPQNYVSVAAMPGAQSHSPIHRSVNWAGSLGDWDKIQLSSTKTPTTRARPSSPNCMKTRRSTMF